MTTFSTNFKKARVASGLTQNEVADHFGLTRGAIAQWESGAIYPETNRIAEIAELLDVSLDHLFRAHRETSAAEKQPFISKFWMVFGIDQRSPVCRHFSEDSAKTEALRLAKLNPDIVFTVLEATWGVASKSAVTEFSVVLSDDDIPF